MELDNKLAWEALEYEDVERTKDWFWALGTVVVAGSIASVIWGNYFFAVLLVIGGIMIGLFANKKPRTIPYELNSLGLKIGSELFPYPRMKSFHIQKEGLPVLFIRSERIFMPVLGVPISEEIFDDIEQILLHYEVPEEVMQEHPSDKIMKYFGL